MSANLIRKVGTQCCDEAYHETVRGACFSADRTHRFSLWSKFSVPENLIGKPMLVALMCNPSTADEAVLDPTLTRVAWWARHLGCGGFEVVNAFSFKATDPKELEANIDPFALDMLHRLRNEHTNAHIMRAVKNAGVVMVGWGALLAKPPLSYRIRFELKKMLREHPVACWKTTAGGHPAHPLYLPKTLEPFAYEWPE